MIRVVPFLLAAFIPLAASVGASERPAEILTGGERISITNPIWDHSAAPGGGEAFAFYTRDGRLLARLGGDELREYGTHDGPVFRAGLGVAADDEGGALLWWVKDPEKAVFLYAPGMEAPVDLDEGQTDALPELALLTNPKGGYRALWIGERPIPDQPVYNAYYREQGGELERVLQAHQLNWAAEPDGTLVVFGQRVARDGHAVLARVRAPDATEFGPEVVVAETGPMGALQRAWSSEGVWAVAWEQSLEGEGIANQIMLAVSADRGETWDTHGFPGARGVLWNDVEFAADGEGNVVVALTGTEPDPVRDVRTPHLAVFRSDDGGQTWGDALHPRDEVWAYSRVHSAKLVPGAKAGELYLLWEDWRSLRPQVYGGYSTDFGATWEIMDARLATQQDERTGFASWREVHRQGPEGPYLVASRYRNDGYLDFGIMRLDLRPEFESVVVSDLGPANVEEGEAALRERVLEYWELMGARDWVGTYAMLSPAARDRWPLMGYISRRGPVVFSEPQVTSARFKGPIAEVSLDIQVAIPSERVAGEVLNLPEPQQIHITQRWVWLDGNWYHEYHEESSGLRYAPYIRP